MRDVFAMLDHLRGSAAMPPPPLSTPTQLAPRAPTRKPMTVSTMLAEGLIPPGFEGGVFDATRR